MEKTFSLLPKLPVKVHCDSIKGEFSGWRHSIGHGGINSYPLPPKVQRGLAACKPKLVRTFIQEYFYIYPDHYTYDWSRLDPYMESLAASGASIVACICFKPHVLYPEKNERVIMPNNINEWQTLIEAVVKRYSVEKEMVTYWEISNESDIGEVGGCPYLTPEPDEYNEYYRITQEAILRAFPQAKVGGPGLSMPTHALLEGILSYCPKNNLQLDFVSWHVYSDNSEWVVKNVKRTRELANKYYPDKHIEILITEFGKGFDDVCVEENAFDSFRAASVGAQLFDLMDTTVDWTFYYHIWDQVFVASQFRAFYEKLDIMLEHWNKIPHRFGLFGVCGEVRPTYFVYRMLEMMNGTKELTVDNNSYDLRVRGVKSSDGTYSVMIVNYDFRKSRDVVVELETLNIEDGLRLLTTYRIDNKQKWVDDTLSLIPVERRHIDISAKDSERAFYCNLYCPADSVTFIQLEAVTEAQMLEEYAKM